MQSSGCLRQDSQVCRQLFLLRQLISLKLIGSTKTVIFGVLEPLSALFFGVTVFHEELTTRIIAGVTLILTGVLLIVSINKKETKQT